MSTTWTNTTTALPYGYQVKLEFIGDAGTGTTNTVNGGYIVNVANHTNAVDGLTGERKFPTFTITVRNVAHFFTGTFFTGSFFTNQIICNLWISYDDKTVGGVRTWENLFFGFVELKSITEKHVANIESYTRQFQFTVKHAWLSFKDAYPSTAPGLEAFPAGCLHAITNFADYHIRIMTSPTDYVMQPSNQCFAGITSLLYLHDIFDFVYGTIPEYYGGFPISWNVTNDYSLLSEYRFAYDGRTPISAATISEIAIGVAPLSGSPGDHWGYFLKGGPGGIRPSGDSFNFPDDAKSWYDIGKGLTDSLFLICDPVMSAAGTVTNYHKLRLTDNGAAVTGTLPNPFQVSMDHSNWVSGVSVSTRGLSEPSTAGSQSGAGQQVTFKTNLMMMSAAGISSSVDHWTNLQYLSEGGGKECTQPWMNQLYIYRNPGASEIIRDVNSIRFTSSQGYFPNPSPSGFYGLQNAIFSMLYSNSPIGLYNPLACEKWNLAFHTLRGSTCQDIGLLKTIPFTVDGVSRTLVITSISRDVLKNTMEIEGYKI